MGQLVFILGKPGTGKSFSIKNFDSNEVALINVQGKILPFKGSSKIESLTTDDSEEIVNAIEKFAHTYKVIIVDDFQYVMANEFMRRATERGYDKFTEIGRHAWDIANCVRELKDDVIVYVMCHTDTDADGFEKLKTIGKMLDEKIFMEGMSTIVLKTCVSDGKYTFITQNNGHDTTKSPADMFPSYAIDNDLKYVDDKIRSYYGFEGAKTEEEMINEDESVKTNIQPEENKPKRGRRSKTEEEKPANTSEEKLDHQGYSEPQVRRRRRVSDEINNERDKIQEENSEIVANAGLTDSDEDGIDLNEVEMPEVNPMPRRKKRIQEDNDQDESDTENEQEEQIETPVRRRRRRV